MLTQDHCFIMKSLKGRCQYLIFQVSSFFWMLAITALGGKEQREQGKVW